MTVEHAVEHAVESIVAPKELTSEERESSILENQIEYDEKMTKKLIRKIDRHVLPALIILYLLSFLDRTNIGNARLAHLEDDLHMGGLDYNVHHYPRHGSDHSLLV